ncbi:MAG: GntR family transcriptional regulator [Angelakisella sp.]
MAGDPSIGLRNLKSRKLYLQVYEQLKDYILQKQLKPGDKLPTEMEMCALLGVSRNVLREAIKSLEIAGIVSSKPGVGIIIQEFSTDFVFQSLIYHLAWNSEMLLHQTLAVRRTLELGFIDDAFRTIGEAEKTLLEQQVEIMRSSFDIQSKLGSTATMFGTQFYEADATFHKILFSKAENKILSSVIDAVWCCDKYYKQRTAPDYIEHTVTKHKNIVTALRHNSLEEFREAMHYHFDVQYKVSVLDEEGELNGTDNTI